MIRGVLDWSQLTSPRQYSNVLPLSSLWYWMSRGHLTDHTLSDLLRPPLTLKCPIDCIGSWPVHRWWKWWFTGVTVWHCRQSYKRWGRKLLALLRPSSWPVRFIVNYGLFRGRRSKVHSYINPVRFMGNYKTPRIFSLPPGTSFEVSVRCCHFLYLSACRFLEPWVILTLFFYKFKTSAVSKSSLHDGSAVIYNLICLSGFSLPYFWCNICAQRKEESYHNIQQHLFMTSWMA